MSNVSYVPECKGKLVMEKAIIFFFILFGLLAVGRIISQIVQAGDGVSLFPWGAVFLALIILTFIIRERVRRKKEGYYVQTHGGAEDGYVLYNEDGKALRLYFSRPKDTIYVPSDVKWKEIMPSWARERKVEIMARIRKHVGKRWIGQPWIYEESDKKETLMTQD
jgi:hypothetical protein